MRPLTFLFLIASLALLASCANDKTANADGGDTIANFASIFNGSWVLTDYITAIETTKSPLKSANKLNGIVSLVIDATAPTDSVNVGASLNNHEGYGFTTYLTTGQKPNSLKTNIPDYDTPSNFYELGHETINDQIHLVLYHYTADNSLIDKQLFTKVTDPHPDGDVAWGIQYIVNEKLFAANYLLIDSTGTATKVTLNSDGTLVGYPAFRSYYVFTDFIATEASFDGMAMNMYEDDSASFALQFNKDTTYLYSTVGDEYGPEPLQLGEIKYKLVRQ